MTYAFDGKKYKEAAGPQKGWGIKVIEELDIQGNESVLDLGCGDGFLTHYIATMLNNGKVLGVDSSESMLEEARKNHLLNLSFMQLDINELNFKEEFDIIFSSATLHWVKDHNKLLRNCYKALKPGGRIRFNFAGLGNCPQFSNSVKSIMALPEFRDAFVNFEWPWYMPGTGEYRKNFAGTGYKSISTWLEDTGKDFDRAGLEKWIDQPSILPFLPVLKPEQKQPFRDAVVKKTLEAAKKGDDKYYIDFIRMNVKAVKEIKEVK
jgi:trans-aconitate methyltransferase